MARRFKKRKKSTNVLYFPEQQMHKNKQKFGIRGQLDNIHFKKQNNQTYVYYEVIPIHTSGKISSPTTRAQKKKK